MAIVLTGSRLGVRLSSLLFMLCMDWVRAVNSLTGILTSSGRSINNTVIFNFNVSPYGILYVRWSYTTCDCSTLNCFFENHSCIHFLNNHTGTFEG